MVRAILGGQKTQTRRVMKPRYTADRWTVWPHPGGGFMAVDCPDAEQSRFPVIDTHGFVCPYGVPGDRLWVRETFVLESCRDCGPYPPPFKDGRPINRQQDDDWGEWWEQPHYRATDPIPELAYDDSNEPGCRWKPSIFMPRWASRITLEITDVRVQRVQDVSAKDAVAEACLPGRHGMHTISLNHVSAFDAFRETWNAINAKRGLGWATNPWVWVVEFRRLVP